MVRLKDFQLEALKHIRNGCILCGGVGSGKSITSLAYYYLQEGGDISSLRGGDFKELSENRRPLYIITTARKRDMKEWEIELSRFYFEAEKVDSWNNIGKYTEVRNAFFIFDEQRVIGSGAWVKSFLHISKHNKWILLSATPGDTWSDYIPVFIANGFYKNKTEFIKRHVVYNPYVKFPQIQRYLDQGILYKLRKQILVHMDYQRNTVPIEEEVNCQYDISTYKELLRLRWNHYEARPIESASELCYLWRKVVNSDASRVLALHDILTEHKRAIIFYSFNYELDILLGIEYGDGVEVAQYNGHQHDPLPETDRWVYLVQYVAGAEGWNCITCDTIIFYSQQYSYKILEQCKGRIDRMNTPYTYLYYYYLKSKAPIDLAIGRALYKKEKFQESKFLAGKW